MTDDEELVHVCDVEDLQPGEKTQVMVQGTPVCVRNISEEYYALENECPHQGGPLCQGKVQPELVGEFEQPGERVREYHGDNLVVACPWHGWEYDLQTGKHLGVEDIAVKTYNVVIEGDVLYVEKSASSPDDQ